MTDLSAMQIPTHTALSDTFVLGLKPATPAMRSYRQNIAPQNKATFVGGDQVIFEIPTGKRNTFLDQTQTYLKFTANFVASAACTTIPASGTQLPINGIYLDNSAYSFIQRLDVLHASNVLEQINEYGQIANLLLDTQLTMSDKSGLSSMLGTNPFNITTQELGAFSQFGTVVPLQTPGDRSGLPIDAVAVGTGYSGSRPYTFTLPLLSGVVGANAQKCIPLGKLNSPIRLEMYLSANDDAIFYSLAGAGATWQLQNVELVCTFVEINDSTFNSSIIPGEVDYIATTTYRQVSASLPGTYQGEFTTLLPFRCCSLKGLFARFRPFVSSTQGAVNTATYRKGASINPNFGQYYWRIANTIMPQKPVYLMNGSLVGGGAEGYAELLKSNHSLGSALGNTALTYQMYNVCAGNTAVTAGTGVTTIAPTNVLNGWYQYYNPGSLAAGNQPTCNNAFAIGQELETISNRSDTILSGISTLNSQLFFTGVVYTGLSAGGYQGTQISNYTCDFFAQMDLILIIQDGIMRGKI